MYPGNSSHIVYSGTLVGGEQFSCGYWADSSATPPSNADYQAAFEDLVDAQVTDLTTLMSYCLAGAVLSADAYHYTGLSNRASLTAHVDLNIAGGGSAKHPDQCSLVVTQLTGLPGRSYRGRTYLPGNALVLSQEGALDAQLSAAACEDIATAFAGVLNAGPANGFSPVVVSDRLSAMTPMTAIRIDSKIDTQRRRAESVTIRSRAIAEINNT